MSKRMNMLMDSTYSDPKLTFRCQYIDIGLHEHICA